MRPTTAHSGFLVPNAGDVTDTRIAEPDALDFNTLGNTHWGVIDGCAPLISGRTVTISSGHALVDGSLVNVTGGSVTLSNGAALDRWDAVVVDAGGVIRAVTGTTSVNPVFPDISTSYTLLCVVFCPIGGTAFENNLIDKRLMLTPIQVTNKTGTEVIFVNRTNANADTFKITAAGTISWNDGDTALYRDSAGVLRVADSLMVDEDLTVGGDATVGGTLDITGQLTASNIVVAANANGPVTNGALLLTPTAAYLGISGVWVAFSTVETFQSGTIVNSLRSPSEMGTEWLCMDGRRVNEADAPNLFTISALSSFIQNDGQNYMMLPDLRGVVLIGGDTNLAQFAGSNNNVVTLTENNLPLHGHSPSILDSGTHAHTGYTDSEGAHGHTVDIPAHEHAISDVPHSHAPDNNLVGGGGAAMTSHLGFVSFIGQSTTRPGKTSIADSMLDPLVTDTSHTKYTSTALTRTATSNTGITGTRPNTPVSAPTTQNSGHIHPVSVGGGAHSHSLGETSFGASSPVSFSIAQKSLVTYVYIKV